MPPLAVPEVGPCALSGRAWRLWVARHSQEETQSLSAQPLPRVLERAAYKAADFTAFDHPATVIVMHRFPAWMPSLFRVSDLIVRISEAA